MKKSFNKWTGLYNYNRPVVKAVSTPITVIKAKAATLVLRHLGYIV